MHKEFDFNVYEFEPMPFERLEKPLQKVAQKQQLQKKVILETSKRKSSQISFENHQLRKEECFIFDSTRYW